jgi:hypothetical protein
MMRRGFVIALVVVAVVNIGVLGGVMRNRSGEPEATVLLDERELERLPVDRENSALQLRLRYQNAAFDEGPGAASAEDALAPRFLDEARLAALGFDCSASAADEGAASFYRSVLPRPAFIVFSIGGPEWERQVAAWQQRHGQRIEEQIARGDLTGQAINSARTEIAEAPKRLSRLMPVDAGRDAATLRSAHPDRARFLILPGVVRLHFVERGQPGGPSVYGYLINVFPPLLTVPRELRAPLDALREPPSDRRPGRAPGRGLAMLDRAPRYEVKVSVGRALQPWISQVRVLP